MTNIHIWTEQTAAQTLDMAFVYPNLAIHDIQFQIGDDLDSDQLIHHHIGTHILTTPNTNLTRLTEKYSNQHSRKR